MTPEPDTPDRIELPADFADHLAAVGNLDTTPETLSDVWSAFTDQLADSDHEIAAEEMYAEAPTRHEVHVDGRIEYTPCVLDALTAAVLETQSSVTVRSVDPVTRVPVTFTVGAETVRVSPTDAVVTFGIASSIPALESAEESVFEWMLRTSTANVRAAFCQHINAFESPATYEQWAADNDGETVPISPGAADALVRQYVDGS